LSPVLKIGIILAIFKLVGTMPVVIEQFIISARGIEVASIVNLAI
jgi:hypothetical protein